jgi:hypothetical protein
LTSQQKELLVFPFEKKYSKSRVINMYMVIFTTTLIFASLNSLYSKDIFSSLFLFSAAAITSFGFIFNQMKLHDFAKFYVLAIISIIIFYFISYDAAQSGAYLYYFPLSLAIVNIYDFEIKKERAFIFAHFFINAVLITINIFTNYSLFKSKFITPETIEQFFIFNSVFSTLCMSYFLHLIIFMNTRQKKLIHNLTDEMLKSKNFEETKKTSNDILFAELQHRLKNNLSLMSSLIRLKMENVIYENVQEKINEAAHAIQIVADANRFVIFKDNAFCVPAKVYFNEVVDSWISLNGNKKANFALKLADYDINIKQAVPLALILHEIITVFCKLQENKSSEHFLKINLTEIGILHCESSVDNLVEICKTSEQLIQILVEQIDAELVSINLNEFEIKYENHVEQNTLESQSIFT